MLAALPEKAFRRCGNNLVVAGIDIGKKRCRIHLEKRRKKSVGIPGKPHLETLGKIYLVDIAGSDVIADPLDGALVGFTRKGGLHRCGSP